MSIGAGIGFGFLLGAGLFTAWCYYEFMYKKSPAHLEKLKLVDLVHRARLKGHSYDHIEKRLVEYGYTKRFIRSVIKYLKKVYKNVKQTKRKTSRTKTKGRDRLQTGGTTKESRTKTKGTGIKGSGNKTTGNRESDNKLQRSGDIPLRSDSEPSKERGYFD